MPLEHKSFSNTTALDKGIKFDLKDENDSKISKKLHETNNTTKISSITKQGCIPFVVKTMRTRNKNKLKKYLTEMLVNEYLAMHRTTCYLGGFLNSSRDETTVVMIMNQRPMDLCKFSQKVIYSEQDEAENDKYVSIPYCFLQTLTFEILQQLAILKKFGDFSHRDLKHLNILCCFGDITCHPEDVNILEVNNTECKISKKAENRTSVTLKFLRGHFSVILYSIGRMRVDSGRAIAKKWPLLNY